MLRLTEHQKGLLNYLAGMGSANCERFSEKDLDVIKFLESEGLINAKRDMIPTNIPGKGFTVIPGGYKTISISEKGKSFLVETKVDFDRYRHPFIVNTILSILAIIISIASLTISIISMMT